MKVFVAGATGATGIPTVRALVEAGHAVVGLTRSPGKRSLLEEAGATPAVADALDAEALRRVVLDARPEAVVQLLTALPARGPTRLSHLRGTNRLRRDGTRNLLAAAVEAGARRYVSESIILGYGFGANATAPHTEDEPLLRSMPGVSPVDDGLAALAALEDQVLGATELEGMTLRFGFYYGPTSRSTDFMLAMLRRRMLLLPGGGRGVVSLIHTDDAARAVVAAIERGRGGEPYNIVDDEPVSTRDLAGEAARLLGVPAPRTMPSLLARLVAPYLAMGASSVVTASNAKAKRELGWAPRYPTYREGLRATLAEAAAAKTVA